MRYVYYMLCEVLHYIMGYYIVCDVLHYMWGISLYMKYYIIDDLIFQWLLYLMFFYWNLGKHHRFIEHAKSNVVIIFFVNNIKITLLLHVQILFQLMVNNQFYLYSKSRLIWCMPTMLVKSHSCNLCMYNVFVLWLISQCILII